MTLRRKIKQGALAVLWIKVKKKFWIFKLCKTWGRIRIRIGIKMECRGPDPGGHQNDADPQLWFNTLSSTQIFQESKTFSKPYTGTQITKQNTGTVVYNFKSTLSKLPKASNFQRPKLPVFSKTTQLKGAAPETVPPPNFFPLS